MGDWKKVENPVTEISFSWCRRFPGFCRARVFFLDQKWDSMTRNVIPEPMAVASPAPKAPISQANTKK